MFEDLYDELILDHSNSPRNRGALGDGAHQAHLHNPLCGDEIKLSVSFDGEKLSDIKFDGVGCAISQAAASMMTELVQGATIEELQSLANDFSELLKGNASDATREKLGELAALEGVKNYPLRIRCAYLVFEALERILKDRNQ